MLTGTFKKIETALLEVYGQLITGITGITEDRECAAYAGFSFQIGALNIKFRKAKVTPKKIGQFVTLWKRNSSGHTEPFHINDGFDFYIIAAETASHSGFFCFPSKELAERQILTTIKEGKCGFRVYPVWDIPENKQAIRTKEWQDVFFIDLSHADGKDIYKLRVVLNQS